MVTFTLTEFKVDANDTDFVPKTFCGFKSKLQLIFTETPGVTPRKIGWGCAARFPKPLPYL